MSAINHVAAWVAGVVQFLLGAAWYTLLGPAWMAGIGKTEAQLAAEHGHSPLPYVIALGAALVVAYAIAWLLPKLRPADGGRRRENRRHARSRADRLDAGDELRIRGATAVALADQRRLHGGRHDGHGCHRRPLEEEGVTEPLRHEPELPAGALVGGMDPAEAGHRYGRF